MQHRFENFLVAPGDQANGAEDLQDGDLGPQAVAGQALRDHVDRVRMRENVRSSLLQTETKKKIYVRSKLPFATAAAGFASDHRTQLAGNFSRALLGGVDRNFLHLAK